MCDCGTLALLALQAASDPSNDANTTYEIVAVGTNDDGAINYQLQGSDGSLGAVFPACPVCVKPVIEDPDNPGEFIDLPTDPDGNPIVPSPIPSVELIAINFVNLVENADGSVTLNYVAVEEDDGDGDPATHPFAITIPPDKFGTLTDNANGTATYVGVDSAGGPVSCAVDLTKNLKCDGSDYAKGDTLTPLTQEQGHAPAIVSAADLTSCGVDPSCAPPIPACPIDGMITTTQNDYGTVMWEMRGGAWVPIMVSPRADSSFTQGAVTNYVDADLVGLNGAGNAWTAVETIEHTVTNDDCVPWCVNFRARNHTQAAMLVGSRAEIRMTNSPGNTVPSWDGGPFHNYDYRSFAGSGVVRNAYGDMYRWNRNKQILQPGQSMTAGVVTEIRVPQYASNPNAAVTIGNFSVTADIWRSLDC